MNDQKLTFERDGAYFRGPRVEDMDVNREHSGTTATAPMNNIPKVGAPTISVPKPSRPGTFNLASLKSSIAHSDEPAKVELPSPGDKELKPFQEVKSEAPTQSEDKMSASSILEFAAADHTSAEKEQMLDSTEESAKPESSVEENVPETIAVQGVTVERVAPVEVEVVPVKETHKPASFDLNMLKKQDAASTQEVAGEVKEIDLEGDVAPTQVETATYSGPSFTKVTVDDFCELNKVDPAQLYKWCTKCVKQAVNMPSAIFCPAFAENVRFYNFFSVSDKNAFGVVLGSGNAIVCARVSTKYGIIEDELQKILTVDGEVALVNGDVMALYTERLRGAVCV